MNGYGRHVEKSGVAVDNSAIWRMTGKSFSSGAKFVQVHNMLWFSNVRIGNTMVVDLVQNTDFQCRKICRQQVLLLSGSGEDIVD